MSDILQYRGAAVQRHCSYSKYMGSTENISENERIQEKRETFASLYNTDVIILGEQVM